MVNKCYSFVLTARRVSEIYLVKVVGCYYMVILSFNFIIAI